MGETRDTVGSSSPGMFRPTKASCSASPVAGRAFQLAKRQSGERGNDVEVIGSSVQVGRSSEEDLGRAAEDQKERFGPVGRAIEGVGSSVEGSGQDIADTLLRPNCQAMAAFFVL